MKVELTQGDREAALNFNLVTGGSLRDSEEAALVEYFARFRITATEAERERCAKLAEGCDLPTRDWMPQSLYGTIRREVANAIRRAGK